MEIPIKSLLDRYKSLVPTNRVVKDAVVDTLKEVCGITIETNQVEVRNQKVFLRVPQPIRIIIYRKKEEILSNISSHTDKTVTDIR